MPMNRYGMKKGKLPLGFLFMVGMLVGILLISVKKRMLLEGTGMLDEYTLYQMKYMTVDSNVFFYYVVRTRMKQVITVAVLATTYLGLLVCAGAVFWYGLSAGAFLATVVIRYGLKGILFAMAGVMPQYILYVPAIAALLVWSESLNRSIYYRTGVSREEKGKLWPRRLLQLVGILALVLMGCLLESFVNPGLLEKFLKIF